MAVGGLAGLINGTISVWARIPSFIVTLGMLEAARGGAYLATDSQTAYIGSTVEWIGAPVPGLALSPAVLTALAVVIVGQVVLTRTVFGRHLIAIGTNAEAVRMAEIVKQIGRITKYETKQYVGSAQILDLEKSSGQEPSDERRRQTEGTASRSEAQPSDLRALPPTRGAKPQ